MTKKEKECREHQRMISDCMGAKHSDTITSSISELQIDDNIGNSNIGSEYSR